MSLDIGAFLLISKVPSPQLWFYLLLVIKYRMFSGFYVKANQAAACSASKVAQYFIFNFLKKKHLQNLLHGYFCTMTAAKRLQI